MLHQQWTSLFLGQVLGLLLALLALLAVPGARLGVRAQSGDLSCYSGTRGWDFPCLVRQAQYTLLGEVVSNDLGGGGVPSNYSARVRVLCTWTSFSSPPTIASSPTGSIIDLVRVGNPSPLCQQRAMGTTAVVGARQLFLVYVAQSPNANDTRTVYQSTSACAGDFLPSPMGTLQALSNVYNVSVPNRILNRGPDPLCALPPAQAGTSPVDGSGDLAPDSGVQGHRGRMSPFVLLVSPLLLLLGLLLMWA